jgi:hypothetical protein
MMLFDKTGKPAVALRGIAMLAGLLPLVGCSDSASTGTAYGSGDKRNDPVLNTEGRKEAMEAFKAKSLGLKKGSPAAPKPPG